MLKTGFTVNDTSILFIFKEKITGQTDSDCAKDVDTMMPLKYLTNY